MSEAEAARLLGLDGAMPDWMQGLLITDSALRDNPIIFASRGFLTLTGYAEADVVGRNCRFLQGPGTNRRTVATMRDAIAVRRRFDGDILNYRADGRAFWNRLSIGSLASESNTLFVGLQFDVTAQRR